ncbi:hypothetical protein ACFQL5_19550 [Aquipuribacter hungaricus]|uniref:hypothetical protein n=1 Tax=Aquipuribacter hungaricus TaxID=545624 RepID=UPI003624453D
MTTSHPAPLDTDRDEAAARALLDDKITAVRGLALARRHRDDARAALVAAERDDATAHAAALRAGWTTEELRRVGLDAPTARTPGRPRGTRHTPRPPTRASTRPDTRLGTAPDTEQDPEPGA